MEILRLDKAIAQLKKEKEQLSKSLKQRRDLSIQMNDHLYIEEIIKDLHPSSSSDEANDAIKVLLEKNSSLEEEVRKLRTQKEIQSIRLCEIMEDKNKTNVEVEGKDNGIQHLSL